MTSPSPLPQAVVKEVTAKIKNHLEDPIRIAPLPQAMGQVGKKPAEAERCPPPAYLAWPPLPPTASGCQLCTNQQAGWNLLGAEEDLHTPPTPFLGMCQARNNLESSRCKDMGEQGCSGITPLLLLAVPHIVAAGRPI